jgi:hypothetical protein
MVGNRSSENQISPPADAVKSCDCGDCVNSDCVNARGFLRNKEPQAIKSIAVDSSNKRVKYRPIYD